MDTRYLNPLGAMALQSGPKLRQINDAKEMQGLIEDRAKRQGKDPPPYEFLELIGKGTYGRVYKSKSEASDTRGEVVAVKIIDVDTPDYREATWDSRDDTINNFTKEISALQRLKDSGAKNITLIHEAFTFDSQLWLVSEYCQGGSVSTLLKASPAGGGLEEQFIVPIARELAVALKYIHDAGIVHRDIKCGNILIMEDGALRLADFGVAGIFESNVSKRSTIIGTPHWMPLELVKELGNENANVTYGTEVDIWAYGCAVYEMATGHGPNQRVRPTDLAEALRENAPRLEPSDRYSNRLRAFVEFCLQMLPQNRPSAAQLLDNSYLVRTETRHPTDSLQILVERFYAWEKKGGERKSLFMNVGAALPEHLADGDEEEDEWYFSTTLAFEQRLEDAAHETLYDAINAESNLGTATGPVKMTPRERRLKAEEGAGADRGGRALGAIFDMAGDEYKYSDRPAVEASRRESDLPFRNIGAGRPADRTTMIDLDMADTLDLVPDMMDTSTLRASRSNRFFTDSESSDESDDEQTWTNSKRDSNRKTTEWKMPLTTSAAVIESDTNRRTVDWKFPSAAPADNGAKAQQTARRLGRESVSNRDTMSFSFPIAPAPASAPTANPDPLATSTARDIPVRPALRTAATMPVGASEGLQLSNSPDRGSMIDLDSIGMPVAAAEPSRPSTSASNMSFAEYAPKHEAVPLLQEPQVLPPPIPRSLADNSNRSSLHRQSQSEPNARSSKGSELDAQMDPNASWHIRDPSAASETQTMMTSASRNFDQIRHDRRSGEKHRRYASRSSNDSTSHTGDEHRPRVAGVYRPSGSKRDAMSLRSQDSTLVGSGGLTSSSSTASVSSLHNRVKSENAFERQKVLKDAHRELSNMLLGMQMTKALYEASEGVHIAKSNAGPAYQYWKKKTEGWAEVTFKSAVSSDLVSLRK